MGERARLFPVSIPQPRFVVPARSNNKIAVRAERGARDPISVAIEHCDPMAGLEPARANYDPSDFKSVSGEQNALTAASRRFREAYQGDS